MVRSSSVKKDEIVRNIISKLAPCRYSAVLQVARKELDKFKLSDAQFANIKKAVFEKLHDIPLKWQKQQHEYKIYSPYPNPFPYELIGHLGKTSMPVTSPPFILTSFQNRFQKPSIWRFQKKRKTGKALQIIKVWILKWFGMSL